MGVGYFKQICLNGCTFMSRNRLQGHYIVKIPAMNRLKINPYLPTMYNMIGLCLHIVHRKG